MLFISSCSCHLTLTVMDRNVVLSDGVDDVRSSLMKYIERFFTISTSLIANDSNLNKTELLEYLGTKTDSSENAQDKKR